MRSGIEVLTVEAPLHGTTLDITGDFAAAVSLHVLVIGYGGKHPVTYRRPASRGEALLVRPGALVALGLGLATKPFYRSISTLTEAGGGQRLQLRWCGGVFCAYSGRYSVRHRFEGGQRRKEGRP